MTGIINLPIMGKVNGQHTSNPMRIISRAKLREFWEQRNRSDSKKQIEAWYKEAKNANWKTSHEIKKQYASASILANNRVVFNICGNKYRLVVAMKYEFSICYIRFIGTHEEYDAIDASTV